MPSSSEQQQQYRPMMPERKASLKLKKVRVLQSVFRQIYEDTEKWWHKSAARFDHSSQQELSEEEVPKQQVPQRVGSQDIKHVEAQQVA
jgi:hypothetical protein